MSDSPNLNPCAAALSEVMGSYRHEMTAFEAAAWSKIIESVPQERFLAFLSHHYQVSTFRPLPADASKYLDQAVDQEVAYAKLERLVRDLGPYVDPQIDDDPILVATVLNLGGWATVNERFPDPSQTFEVRAFKERFIANFNQALVHVRIYKQLPTQKLVPIGASPLALPAPRLERLTAGAVDAPRPARAAVLPRTERFKSMERSPHRDVP
jgi:hypothetical protein